jgi:hypothetical protein
MPLPTDSDRAAAGETLPDTTTSTPSSPAAAASPPPQPQPAPVPAGKKLVFSLVLLGLLWGFVELACFVGLWALSRYKDLDYSPELVRSLSERHRGVLEGYLAGEPTYLVFSRTLGWTIGPKHSNATYHANSQGLRADHDYAPAPPAGRVRVAAFGDSFTHSSDVPDGASWEVDMERLEPRVEVMNFGVPGFGLDQAYLRYLQDGVVFRPEVVLIDFMSDNINRVVNVYRPFFFYRSGLPFTKPRFELRGGKLTPVENPISTLEGYRDLLNHPDAKLDEIGQHDFFYQRNNQRSRLDFLPSVRFVHVMREQYAEPILRDGVYNTRSEPFQVTAGIVDSFYRDAIAHGSVPIVVFFPDKPDIRALREGRGKVYEPLIQHVDRQGYRRIDLLDGFQRYGKDAELNEITHVHYTRRGCQMAAQWLLDYLRANRLTTPEGVATARAADARPRG